MQGANPGAVGAAPPKPGKRRGWGWLATGLVMIVVGPVVAWLLGLFGLMGQFQDFEDSLVAASPSGSIQIEQGQQVQIWVGVVEQADTHCQWSGPGDLALEAIGHRSTRTINGNRYTLAMEGEATASGTYSLACSATPDAPVYASLDRAGFPWGFALVALGGVLAILGVVFFIIGAVKLVKSAPKRPPARPYQPYREFPGGPPAGFVN